MCIHCESSHRTEQAEWRYSILYCLLVGADPLRKVHTSDLVAGMGYDTFKPVECTVAFMLGPQRKPGPPVTVLFKALTQAMRTTEIKTSFEKFYSDLQKPLRALEAYPALGRLPEKARLEEVRVQSREHGPVRLLELHCPGLQRLGRRGGEARFEAEADGNLRGASDGRRSVHSALDG